MQPFSAIDTATASVVAIHTRAELVAASGHDQVVRCFVPLEDQVEAWALGTGVVWFIASRRRQGAGWLTVIAAPEDVPVLLQAAADEVGDRLSGVTVPAAALPHLPAGLQPLDPNLWDWFFTATAPPHQPGEEAVVWAAPDDEPAIAALLDADSPRHSARPGDVDVLRWCVVRDDTGGLLACAANTEHVPGVAHLASIVSRTDQRGRGLGRAVTAWITRQLLDDGAPVVTLGMYADNDVARRLYLALGYACARELASGYLPDRRAPGDANPVHDQAD